MKQCGNVVVKIVKYNYSQVKDNHLSFDISLYGAVIICV